MKLWQKIVSGLIIFLFVLTGGFVIWGETPAQAMPEAIAALTSDDAIQVQTGDWLVFQPADREATTGFIFYPGGRVDYGAYAPMAHELAAQGFMVVIPRMPLNLAVFGIEAAGKVMQAYPNIQHWAIGGHSLGGSMAAHYLFQHQSDFAGLVFLASYPASSDDLKQFTGDVLSISGSLDGLATPEKIGASRALLPLSTQFVEIQGGNHAGFGWYGAQSGDNQATISREEQQAIVVESISNLLSKIDTKE